METTTTTSLAPPAPGAAAAAIAALRSKANGSKPAPKASKPTKVAKAKKPTKVAKVRDPNAKRIVRIKGQPHDVSHYRTTKTATGNSSLDCGDPLARSLAGQELDDVYKLAAKILGEAERTLRDRYLKLNPGMQRMNLGNRIRAFEARKAAKAA